MFGIGSTELLVILVVALLVLGPKSLPKVAQTLGRAMGEFRRVSTEFQRTLNTEIAFEEEAEKKNKELKEAEAARAGKETEAAEESKTDAPPARDSSRDSPRPLTTEALAPNTASDAAPSAPLSGATAGNAKTEEKA